MTTAPSLRWVLIKILGLCVLVGLLIALAVFVHPAMVLPALILLKIIDIFWDGFNRGYQQADEVLMEKPKRKPRTDRLIDPEDEDSDELTVDTDLPEKAKRH